MSLSMPFNKQINVIKKAIQGSLSLIEIAFLLEKAFPRNYKTDFFKKIRSIPDLEFIEHYLNYICPTKSKLQPLFI